MKDDKSELPEKDREGRSYIFYVIISSTLYSYSIIMLDTSIN